MTTIQDIADLNMWIAAKKAAAIHKAHGFQHGSMGADLVAMFATLEREYARFTGSVDIVRCKQQFAEQYHYRMSR